MYAIYDVRVWMVAAGGASRRGGEETVSMENDSQRSKQAEREKETRRAE